MTQLIAAIRRVGRDVPGAKDLIGVHCTRLAALTGQDYTGTGKPRIAWDDPAARDELVTALVNDALALLAALDVEAIEDAGGKPAEAVALLALVAGQDVEPAEDSDGTDGRWRIARKTAPDRMISTVDPDARHAHKTRERRQDGFKAHVVVEPDTGLTTAVKLTKTNGPDNSDADRRRRLVADRPRPSPRVSTCRGAGRLGLRHRRHAPHPGRQAVDPTAQAVAAQARRRGRLHHRRLHPRPQAPAPLTCPAGITRTITASGNVVFGIACRGCPLAARCTTVDARAAPSCCTNTTSCNANTANEPPTKASKPPTASTGRWSSDPSPGSPAATAGCPTAGSRRTTTGSTTASPHSTCADCSPWASPSTDGTWALA